MYRPYRLSGNENQSTCARVASAISAFRAHRAHMHNVWWLLQLPSLNPSACGSRSAIFRPKREPGPRRRYSHSAWIGWPPQRAGAYRAAIYVHCPQRKVALRYGPTIIIYSVQYLFPKTKKWKKKYKKLITAEYIIGFYIMLCTIRRFIIHR